MKLTYSVKLDTRKLDSIRASDRNRAEAVLEVAARHIEGMAKGLAPVDTGALRASIHVSQERPLQRTIGDGVEYGIYQEFGTRHMPAHPFLLPALEAERRPLNQAWEALIK